MTANVISNKFWQINETKSKIQESLKELESHKAKRMAARNEMIHLAKALDRAQSDGVELKNSVQFILSPMVFEQVLDA